VIRKYLDAEHQSVTLLCMSFGWIDECVSGKYR